MEQVERDQASGSQFLAGNAMGLLHAPHLGELLPVVYEFIIVAQVNDLIVVVQAQDIVPQLQNCIRIAFSVWLVSFRLPLRLWERCCPYFLGQHQGQQAE